MLKMYILGVGDMVGVFALRLRERLAAFLGKKVFSHFLGLLAYGCSENLLVVIQLN